jgi:hypothetical protein
MRRTQLYLDDQLWNVLHLRAREENTTVSDLVRSAVRDRYLGGREQRMEAMRKFAGSRKSPATMTTEEEVRALRRGTRMDRLGL